MMRIFWFGWSFKLIHTSMYTVRQVHASTQHGSTTLCHRTCEKLIVCCLRFFFFMTSCFAIISSWWHSKEAANTFATLISGGWGGCSHMQECVVAGQKNLPDAALETALALSSAQLGSAQLRTQELVLLEAWRCCEDHFVLTVGTGRLDIRTSWPSPPQEEVWHHRSSVTLFEHSFCRGCGCHGCSQETAGCLKRPTRSSVWR